MNLQSISRLPAEAFAPLGKSRRQQAEEAAAAQPKPAHQPTPITAPPGYRVTPQGGLQRDDQAPLIPEVKGRLLKADDTATCGVVPSVDDLSAAWYSALQRAPLACAWDAALAVVQDVKDAFIDEHGSFRVIHDTPADRRADVIASLNKLGA